MTANANTLQAYQDSLAQLISAGSFTFSNDLATLTEAQYNDLLTTEIPEDYEIAYQMDNGLNIIERLAIGRNGQGFVDALVYERTWEELGFRVFEFEIKTVRSRLLGTTEEEDASRVITMTWWLLDNGSVVHYRAMLNQAVIISIGILSGINK